MNTPALYSTGKWDIRTPFEVDANSVYVCIAIRSFQELRASGIDPFTQFYQPLGISEEVFLQDERNLVNVVTLFSDTQPMAFIPDSYIESYPDNTTMPYKHMVLSISLGAVPDTLVLTDIKEKVANLVLAEMGINTIVKEHHAGCATEFLSLQEHKVVEANRLSRLETNKSLYTVIAEQQRQIDQLTQNNKVLEEVIVKAGLV